MRHFLVQFQNDFDCQYLHEERETVGIHDSLKAAQKQIEQYNNLDEYNCREYKWAYIEEWYGISKEGSWKYKANKQCPVFSFEFESSLTKSK